MRISHSKIELYNQCPKKYQFTYIDKLTPDKTFSPLLFGSACDKAFNYLLLRKKRNKVIYNNTAKAILLKEMSKWQGQNEFVFFKNEVSPACAVEDDPEGNQIRAHAELCETGKLMIDTYVKDILPLFKEVNAVQVRKDIPNEEGDSLTLIVDAVVTLQDGRKLTLDNKTTSSIKKSYPDGCVKKSQQLAIYTEYAETRTAGYIVLQKRPENGIITWQLITDDVPEEQSEKAFEKVDKTLRAIKKEEFPKNEKSCFKFGRCAFFAYCKYGSKKGIIKK